MAKGERRSVQERLDAIVEERADALARFQKADAVRAKKERALREKIVRERVLAEVNIDVEAKVQERLAELENGDANAVVEGDQAETEDAYDAQGHYVNA